MINRTAVEMIGAFMEQAGGRPFDYEICPAPKLDRPLVVLRQVNPMYSLGAKQQGVAGRVRVKFYVDEQGGVRLPTVTADAHPYLSAAAVQALLNWKFSIPTRNGRPVLVAATQDFDFGGGP